MYIQKYVSLSWISSLKRKRRIKKKEGEKNDREK